MKVYVDVIIENSQGEILLVNRGVEPLGWALPGGYVDSKETPWQAAMREVLEETGARIELIEQFCVYPFVRSEKGCTAITIVYLAKISTAQTLEKLKANSDVIDLMFDSLNNFPDLIKAHQSILSDYLKWKKNKIRPNPHANLKSSRDEELHVHGVLEVKKVA